MEMGVLFGTTTVPGMHGTKEVTRRKESSQQVAAEEEVEEQKEQQREEVVQQPLAPLTKILRDTADPQIVSIAGHGDTRRLTAR